MFALRVLSQAAGVGYRERDAQWGCVECGVPRLHKILSGYKSATLKNDCPPGTRLEWHYNLRGEPPAHANE